MASWGVPRGLPKSMQAGAAPSFADVIAMVGQLPPDAGGPMPVPMPAPVAAGPLASTPLPAAPLPIKPVGNGPGGMVDRFLEMQEQADAMAQAPRRPSTFARGGTGRHVLGILGDALAGAAGRPATYAPAMVRQQQMEMQQQRWQSEQDLAERRLRQPQFANVENVGYVAIDPETLTSRVVQPARSDGVAYAESLGLTPGTPQYDRALSDYALRTYGPSALEHRTAIEEDRQEAAIARMEAQLELRRDLARARELTTRRGQDLTDTRGRRGQDMTDVRGRRGQDLTNSRPTRGRAGRAGGGGAVIVNPRTGQRMRNEGGRWVPVP